MTADLRHRGGGIRESGAFLLGRISGGTRYVEAWIPYDELDPDAFARGYVRVSTAAFTRLWQACSELNLTVVGDVHTHPRGPGQSRSDKANPMISLVGHIALIIPHYAIEIVSAGDVSVNVYQGSKKWDCFIGREAQHRLRIL